MAMVVATVMIEPRIIGTITRKKSWRSLAPSSRAASRTSPDTPLIAAEKTTMAKPVWSQIRITISQKMLIGLRRQPRDRLAAEADHDRVQQSDLRLARGLPGVDEAPDDRCADERDRQRQEDEGLGQRLASDAIEEPGDDEPEHDAAAGPDDQPDDVVAQDRDELGLEQHRVVGERELAGLVLKAAQDRSRRRVDQEDRQQRQGGADEDPRQDPVAPLRLEQADQRADAEEQQPDAADADRQGDRRQQDLGDQLIARPFRRSVAPDVLPSAS